MFARRIVGGRVSNSLRTDFVLDARHSLSDVPGTIQVLWAALNYMPPGDLRELILERLGRKGMDPAQRGTWLGAGLFVDRDACLPRVVEFVSNGTETRCRHLLEFLVPHLDPLPNQQWPTADLAALIKAIGARVSSPSDAGGFVLGWKLRPLLDVWLDTLANRVDEEP